MTSSNTSSAPHVVAGLAQALEEAGRRRDAAHVAGHRLDDHARELVAVALDHVVRTLARSLNGAVRVSAVVAGGTPGEAGMPSVARPEPASTSSASAWPW